MKIEIHVHGPVTVNIAPEPTATEIQSMVINTDEPDMDRVMVGFRDYLGKRFSKHTPDAEPTKPEPTYTLDVELRDGGVHYSCGISNEHAAVNAKVHAIVSEDIKRLIGDKLVSGDRVVAILDNHRDEITALGITDASIWQGKKSTGLLAGTSNGILAGVWTPQASAEIPE